MVYNWRTNNKSAEQFIYPKYESIKTDFFKYWELLSTYIRQYKDRKLKIKRQELYYSNVLSIGEDHFLKNSSDLFKAFSIISPYPEGYVNINSQINLQIPIEDNLLFLNLNKIKIENKEEIAFVLMMRSKNEIVENITENWYNDAHLCIKDFFKKITTEDIRNYWKGGY